ncbi:ankyrin repeat domain-containing protein [Noviherbaspirillum pedocola]|uniref:Ankyrin repeat domain-containing protein n=1 Tax=Noviherbaspirillum pedocola TaxID=2801341 RepID=A0A934W8Q3_9BURK|nr:ankyrin repeat domain-containing protein [Noviherbaspirillum pedocola]MBK4737068.1 ankyrin repeat domain-containing protein [Noviherbaspirillum pedocola]
MHISSLPSPEVPNDQPSPYSHAAQTTVAQAPLPGAQQPQQPGIGVRDGATHTLPARGTQHAQPQPVALTTAPLLGTPAKRSTPDTGFDQDDANDAKRMRTQLPETPVQAPEPAQRPALTPAPALDAQAVPGMDEDGMDVDTAVPLQPTANTTVPVLIEAILQDDWPRFRALLGQTGIDVNATDDTGATALHHVLRKGWHEMAQRLLKVPGIDVRARDDTGATALHHALCAGLDEIAELLLKVPDIDVNIRDAHDVTPLMCAASQAHEQAVRALLACPGIDVHACDDEGDTAFVKALKESNYETIRQLFLVGIEEKGARLQDQLLIAAAKGDVAAVEALLADPEVDVNVEDAFGKDTALMLAAAHGQEATFRRLLLAPGINLEKKDGNGHNILMQLVLREDECLLRCLLERPGLDVNQTNRIGFTALRSAVQIGNYNIALALLAVPGIDVHAPTPALVDAVVGLRKDIVSMLIAMPGIRTDFKFNSKPLFLRNYLLLSSFENHWFHNENIVRLLLAMPNTDVNARDNEGTPLLLSAVKGKSEAAVRALLAMPDIRTDVKDAEGRTALCIAKEMGQEAIITMLRNHVPMLVPEPGTVLRFLRKVFTVHADEWQQTASSSASTSLDAANRLDELCESLQFGKLARADVLTALTSLDALPNDAPSSIAMALAFAVCTGHYRNADGKLDPDIDQALCNTGFSTAYDNAANRLWIAAQHINLFHVDGMNLLGIAARDGNERMIRGLVRMGAYINLPSPNGKTALAIAVENRQWGACAELVFHGALPTLPLHDGYPALYHIVRDFGSVDYSSESLAYLIRYLCMKGVRFDIPVKNPDADTRAQQPTVMLDELLFASTESWIKYGHIVLKPKNAAPSAASAPTSTASTSAEPILPT